MTNIINTTRGPRPDAKSDIASESPIASKLQPGVGAGHAVSESDLESRIKVRRAELVGKLGELRTNARLEAAKAADKLKAELSQLSHIIKEGIVDGWANLGDTVKAKLERWLAESGRHPSENVPTEIASRDVPTKIEQS